MAKQEIPRGEFIPHPTGQHEGEICLIEDLGIKVTSFGEKHKCAVRIQSDTAFMDDGQPFIVQQWYTISGHPKSSLRQFRELVAGRPLTTEEAYTFDTEDPLLLGKKVGFIIVHAEGKEGGTFANIQAIWPLKGGTKVAKPRTEYFMRLIDVRAQANLMKAEDAVKAAHWAAGDRTPEAMDEAIGKYEADLKAHNMTLPPEKDVPDDDKEGLPF